MEQVRALAPLDDPLSSLPFVHETLSTLRGEIGGSGAALLGFVGTPWTLAAYSVEGRAERNCRRTKTMMYGSPQVLHALLDHLTEALIVYVGYQIEAGAQVGRVRRGGGWCWWWCCWGGWWWWWWWGQGCRAAHDDRAFALPRGARDPARPVVARPSLPCPQVVQLFDSWAHHLTPEQSAEFSMPYAERIIAAVRAKYPHVPLIFHANGGAGKHAQLAACSADVIGLDWECTMAGARQAMGAGRTLQVRGGGAGGVGVQGSGLHRHGRPALPALPASLTNLSPSPCQPCQPNQPGPPASHPPPQGNVDPMVLFGPEAEIREAVTRCLVEAGPHHHILNVGHGVIEGTPEESVGLFCELARQSADILAAHGRAQQQPQPVAA